MSRKAAWRASASASATLRTSSVGASGAGVAVGGAAERSEAKRASMSWSLIGGALVRDGEAEIFRLKSRSAVTGDGGEGPFQLARPAAWAVSTTADQMEGLLQSDAQLAFSRQAVRRYEAAAPEVDDDRKSGHKRHIISVDDHLKINYEVVKNVPGNLVDVASAKGKKAVKADEIARINKFKALYFKEQLHRLHDEFVTKSAALREDGALPAPPAPPSQQQQYEWLCEIQAGLLQQYRDAVQEEKRWYLKKELLLDANIRLDLFTSRDSVSGTLKVGKDNTHKSCIF